MSKIITNLHSAQQRAMTGRPKSGGFPYLAETLRSAGVVRNEWHLPACTSLYWMKEGCVIEQGTPLVSGALEVPCFDQEALVRVLRIDQAGESTFPEFLMAAWSAGVIRYEVDFIGRMVTYFGCRGESYSEQYSAVVISK